MTILCPNCEGECRCSHAVRYLQGCIDEYPARPSAGDLLTPTLVRQETSGELLPPMAPEPHDGGMAGIVLGLCVVFGFIAFLIAVALLGGIASWLGDVVSGPAFLYDRGPNKP